MHKLHQNELKPNAIGGHFTLGVAKTSTFSKFWLSRTAAIAFARPDAHWGIWKDSSQTHTNEHLKQQECSLVLLALPFVVNGCGPARRRQSPLAPRTPPAHRIVSKVPPELLKPPPSGAEPPSAAFTRPPVAWGLGVRAEFIHEFIPIFTEPSDFAAPVSKPVHRSGLMLFWLRIGIMAARACPKWAMFHIAHF